MEISESCMPVYYASKVFALAPFSVKKNAKGVLEIRRSKFFTVYSIVVILVFVFLTYQGLLFDANAEIPLRASFRMKSATSKVVTTLDVSVVVMATTAGTICGLCGFKGTRELNQRLRRVDEVLEPYSNLKRDRLLAIATVAIPLITITTLLGLDFGTWTRTAAKVKTGTANTDVNVRWYIPFYSLYFILTVLQMNIANTAFGLGRRYMRLNRMLKATFLPGYKRKITPIPALSESISSRGTAYFSKSKQLPNEMQNEKDYKNRGVLLQSLAECHESLGICVLRASSSYGISVLFILISCLLHLVATAYFLFLELLNTKDSGFVWLQILWISFHSLRLLFAVEPCHLAARESKKTIKIVCEIERKVNDPLISDEIKKFWQQLLVVDSEFSACGLCQVDRKLLTSISSAIATYLIILIQFQKSNG